MSKPNNNILRNAVRTALMGAAIGGMTCPYAQESDQEGPGDLEEIIVTATKKGQTKLESSIAITIADSAALDKKAPIGVADSLELVPGLWVEDSGGEVSNNVAPRGLGGGAAFRFVGLLEDGLPVHYDGEIVDHLVRPDLTIERFEAIRGGTAGILTTNGPGALINFISRRGTEDSRGAVRLTVSDYDTLRMDTFYSGPVSENWTAMIGGFYRSSDSVRDTGFTADHGGQLRANLTRRFDDGELTFRFKAVNDRNTFLLPIPLQDTSSPRSIPGVDPNYGTMLSLDNSRTLNKTPTGEVETNLRDGFLTEATVLGMYFEKELDNGWVFSNNGSFTNSTLTVNAMFNGGNGSLQLGSERLLEQDVLDMLATFAPDGAVRASLMYSATGELINNPDSINGNGLIQVLIPEWRVRDLTQVVNDTRFTWNTDRNSLTVGLLFASINLARDVAIDSDILSEVKDNPSRLDIVALDAGDNVVGQLTDAGILTHGSWYTDNSGDVKSYSFYVNDTFEVSDDLRIDAGVRFESADYTHLRALRSSQSLNNGDDNILANDTIKSWGTGNFETTTNTIDETAVTVGFNYAFTDTFAIYGRYSDSFQTPTLNYDNGAITAGAAKLEFGEIGLRFVNDHFAGTATLFATEFTNLPFSATSVVTGEVESINISTEATGVEWDFVWLPVDWFRLEGGGVFQDTEITGIPSDAAEGILNGNGVTRTPDTQIRLTSTFSFADTADFYVTYHYLDERFADLGNTLVLPDYTTIDAGVLWSVTDNLDFQIIGRNLSNEVGLTEGNPRSGFSEILTEDSYFARPILGRSWIASVTYNF